MSFREWNSGAPPHIGWWEASIIRSSGLWRWWNGTRWSDAAISSDDMDEVLRCAARIGLNEGISWTDYYPENARVPRIKP
jgi:hypothetical protein